MNRASWRGLAALVLLLALAPLSAEAQRKPVYQDGVILPNHLVKQTTDGLIKDVGTPAAGDAQGRGVSPIGINDALASHGVCAYSANPTVAGTSLCLGHDASGNPVIAVDSVAGAAEKGLNFLINGSLTSWPPTAVGTGNIVGPNTTTPNELMVWNSSIGTLARDGAGVAVAHAGPLSISANPSVAVVLTGNGVQSTIGAFNSQGTALSPTKRETQAQFGMTDAVPTTACTIGGGCDKITLYAGHVSAAHTLNGLAFNALEQINSGWAAAGGGGSWVAELDKDNYDADFGATAGSLGISVPVSYGFNIVTGGTKRNTAAAVIGQTGGSGVHNQWYRGWVCGVDSIDFSTNGVCLADYSDGVTSYEIRGTHTTGISGVNATFSGNFIRGNGFTVGNTGLTGIRIAGDADSGGQPGGVYALAVANAVNSAGQNGLFVKSEWGSAGGIALEVGNDVVAGNYASLLRVGGYLVQAGFTTPVHVASGQTTPPALSACGTSPSILGTDTIGTVTMGTGAPTGCVITFARPYIAQPICLVVWPATPLATQSFTLSPTAITITQTETTSNQVTYHCIGQSGG